MIAGRSASEEDVVYLVEVSSSEAEREQARRSDAVTAWAQGMPQLVAGRPVNVTIACSREGPAGGRLNRPHRCRTTKSS
jgi:hypothetical protein